MTILPEIEKIQILRIKKGLSRYGLSKKAGLSKYAVARLEKGLTNPTPKIAKAIADALEVDLDEIFKIVWHNELLGHDTLI